ncbi:MAG: tetratricopeptide repeat protein [Nitrospinota bacterium]
MLIILTFRIPFMASSEFFIQGHIPWIALTAAILFLSHPVQTEAVTYIFQRLAALATLFYLLTVICYLKWRLAPSAARGRLLWYLFAILSAILTMKTKEISFTLPFMILFMEALLFSTSPKKRWLSLIPFLLTLPIIPLSRINAVVESDIGFARETTVISRLDYLFTQLRVIVTYLRLLVFPVNQNFDYDYPICHSFFRPSVFLSFLFLSFLLSAAIYLFFHSQTSTYKSLHRLISFGILWFFLTIIVESSIIPIRNVICEYRLYLPSIGFFLAMGGAFGLMIEGSEEIWTKGVWRTAIICIIITLSIATYKRNTVWRDEVTLWEDVVLKSPNKARGHNNLGFIYKAQGRLDESIREFQSSLKINPDHIKARRNLGTVYQMQGNLEEAIEQYKIALKLKPNNAMIHYNLGTAYQQQSRILEAREEFIHALKIEPDFVVARRALESISE